MLHRPWSVILIAFAMALAAPSVGALWLFKHHGNLIPALLDINPLYVFLGFASLVVAFGIWRVRPWGYYSFLLLTGTSLGLIFYTYLTSDRFQDYIAIGLLAFLSAGSGLLLQKHVTAPYFNPRLRWWERNDRYRVQLAAKFQIDRHTRRGSLLDISRSGCFAELDAKLIVGEEIEMRMQLLQFDFTTRARVIWSCDDPKGYGLMFLGMTRRHKREIDRIIAYLVDSQGSRGPLINQGIKSA